jgi:uncharacterized protein YggT (Ycf19 family)
MDDNVKPQVPAYLIVGKVITYAMYIWVIFGIIILGIRVFLLAFSANAGTPFVNFIYNTSASFLQPFRGIFPPKTVGDTGYLDVAALFAMIIYGLIGWGFAALIHYIQAKIDAYTDAARERAAQRRQMAQAQALAAQKNTARTTTRKPKQI